MACTPVPGVRPQQPRRYEAETTTPVATIRFDRRRRHLSPPAADPTTSNAVCSRQLPYVNGGVGCNPRVLSRCSLLLCVVRGRAVAEPVAGLHHLTVSTTRRVVLTAAARHSLPRNWPNVRRGRGQADRELLSSVPMAARITAWGTLPRSRGRGARMVGVDQPLGQGDDFGVRVL